MEKHGFTLIELIIIIVLAGIISVFIIPRIDIGIFKESADIDQFISNVRFAQHKSMITGTKWRIKIISSKKYFIDNDTDNNNPFPKLPGGDNPVEVNTSISSSGINEIYFDFLGRPVNSSGNLIKTQIIISIGSENIVIEPYSGGVYKQ